jgi:HEAT repeat protein
LEGLLTSNEPGVPSAAANALAVWGTEESTPALHKALQSNDSMLRADVIRALGQIKSEKSAGPLAARLSDVFDRQQASDALKKIGPKAEKEVVKYLENKQNDVFAREEACRILGEIGTKNGSVPALQKAAKEQNQFGLNNTATAAITSINNRGR